MHCCASAFCQDAFCQFCQDAIILLIVWDKQAPVYVDITHSNVFRNLSLQNYENYQKKTEIDFYSSLTVKKNLLLT